MTLLLLGCAQQSKKNGKVLDFKSAHFRGKMFAQPCLLKSSKSTRGRRKDENKYFNICAQKYQVLHKGMH